MKGLLPRIMVIIAVLALTLGLALGCATAPKATTPEEFYKGKTITWVAPGSAGSGSDLRARALAPFVAKEIGATIKVENLSADEGLNWVYNEGQKDGLTFANNSINAIVTNDILKAPGTQWEAEKFRYLADISPSTYVMQTTPKRALKTLEALRQTKGLKAGASSAKGALAIGGAVSFELLGLDGKVVTGYKSRQDVTMAVARGEVDILVTSDASAAQDEADGNVINVVVMSQERSRAVPAVPTLSEFGVKVPQELEPARQYVSDGGNAALVPPGVPDDRVEYLRKVLQKLADNQDLQKEMTRVNGVWSPFIPGKKVQENIDSIKANKGLADQLDQIFEKRKSVQ
ncbi:MAG: hypothetical protein HYY30_02960 [Chloroflexi bacterium]|nr:hypothetical protein [Chloroflexota bacterium]